MTVQPANDTADPFGIGAAHWPGLAKLTEECGEVLQIVGKLIATGGRTDHWSGLDLRRALIEELGDLEAAIVYFINHNFQVPSAEVFERWQSKLGLFESWHEQSRAR